jgi:phosphohistidine phosphatase
VDTGSKKERSIVCADWKSPDDRPRTIDRAAMRLMLLRHAKAEKAEPGMDDHARRLNSRGQSDAAAIGAYMARHDLSPDRVIVSTSQRTRETWEHLAAELGAAVPATFERALYNAGARAILAVVQRADPKVRKLMVIGHNPGVHDLARFLIASGDVEAREQLNEGLPTSGLALIDFTTSDWRKLHAHGGRLDRFVTPGLLAAADRV